MAPMMHSIRVASFGGPKVMSIAALNIPKPGFGEALVKIGAAGVNPVETYIRSGNYGRLPQLPYTPGHDLAGTVMATGEGVSKFSVGDRVYSAFCKSGSYATHALCDAQHIYTLPHNVTFSQGAAVGIPYATAWHALVNRVQGRAGESVLIHGASGGCGIAAVQIARSRGMNVIGTAGTDAGMELVSKQGAHHVFNHSVKGYENQILEATPDGSGVDVVVEMCGHVNLDKDLDLIRRGGRIVVIGNRGPTQIDARKIMNKEAMVTGHILWDVPQQELDHIHRGIGAGLENGSFKPVVAREYRLEDAYQAHEHIMSQANGGALGKIVLIPPPEV